jgi:enoyl-CoA hydratase
VPIKYECSEGIAEVIIDHPPVNALDVKSWFDLARLIRSLPEDPAVRVIVLRAVGRGFSGGVDIKELDRGGHDALVAVNHGCYQAFAAVYECAVPVIAAVHGYCLGGGIGLAGNADLLIAADDARFALPEVDRGALGAATHLARLVPQKRLRAMMYTGESVTAAELFGYGTALEVVAPAALPGAARRWAQKIAAKSAAVIRAAKASLNGIEPIDVKRSYRFEQGFTFELTLAGVGGEARRAFVEKREPDWSKNRAEDGMSSPLED